LMIWCEIIQIGMTGLEIISISWGLFLEYAGKRQLIFHLKSNLYF